MKKFATKLLTIVAACAALAAFVSCSSPSSSDSSNSSGSGAGGSGSEPTSPYTKYTMNAKEAADEGEVGYLLQVDNDGSQDENGLKITVSDLKIAIKVGDAGWVEKDLGTVNMIPDQYADPAYSKTSCRTVIPGVSFSANTAIQVKVISATVSNESKKSAIICSLQREGGNYQFFGIDNEENWKPAFAAAE